MKPWKILTITTLAIVTAALLAGTAVAFLGPRTTNTYGTFPNGMTGNYPQNVNPQTTTQPPIQTYTPPFQTGRWGGGCWGNTYAYSGTTTTSVTFDTAVQTAKNYVASLNNPDLEVTEVEEYTQNFYVIVSEKSTGTGAFELIIDKYTGTVGPEMGPNRMWNTKYGVQNGMCGWLLGTTTTAPTVTVEQAKANAQLYLNANYAGTTVGDAQAFYGYYHVEVLNAGNTYGMLSVNSYTGQVWFHTWHGAFVQEWTS